MGRIIVQHLRTNVSGKKPSPDDIMNGELAINYAASGETLYIKNSNEEIIEFKDNKYYQTQLSDKVDKVTGKQLSTEDFTSALKTKLESLNNYDDAAIQEAVSGLQTQINTLVSGDASTAIESFNEIIAFLDGVEDTETLDGIIASIEQQIASKYTKPSGGIPKTDLESSVQTSLGKADTALQEHQSLDGYVKDADLSTVATSGSYSDLSDKPTIPDISGKQDELVSGINIKTINGESILGSGNIEIESGGSSAYAEVSHGTSDTTFTLTPNVFHIWDKVSSLTLTLGDETDGIANEFLFQFTSGPTATTLSLPNTIKWANDDAPIINTNKIYQISILGGLACVLEFNKFNLPVFYINGVEFEVEEGMTWENWIASEYNTANYYHDSTTNLVMRDESFNCYALANVVVSDTIIINNNYDETFYGII